MNWEDFPFFSQFFTIPLNCGLAGWGIGYSTEPGRQAHTGSGWLRYDAKILYEIMLAGFLCLTKPAFMRRPWRITPCPAVHGWAFLCFVGIISTVSRQLRYSPSRACVCLPPGFLTLWLYLPSCRFASGCCRGLALCGLGICVCFARSLPGARSVRAWYLCMLCTVSAGGSLCADLVFVYALHGLCRGLAWIYSLSARGCSGLAQHHIECHHKAEAHHKCYGGAV